jgi:hypothetical protein
VCWISWGWVGVWARRVGGVCVGGGSVNGVGQELCIKWNWTGLPRGGGGVCVLASYALHTALVCLGWACGGGPSSAASYHHISITISRGGSILMTLSNAPRKNPRRRSTTLSPLRFFLWTIDQTCPGLACVCVCDYCLCRRVKSRVVCQHGHATGCGFLFSPRKPTSGGQLTACACSSSPSYYVVMCVCVAPGFGIDALNQSTDSRSIDLSAPLPNCCCRVGGWVRCPLFLSLPPPFHG